MRRRRSSWLTRVVFSARSVNNRLHQRPVFERLIQMATSIRIALVEAQSLVREALVFLLKQTPGIELVMHTSGQDLSQIMTAAEQSQVLLLEPPELGGLDLLQKLLQTCPGVKILVLSSNVSPASAARALCAGAIGYVPKTADLNDVVVGIRTVLTGKRYISRVLEAKEVDRLYKKGMHALRFPVDALTPRERQVFEQTAKGLTNVGIGRALGISSRTVEIHRANAMRKLHADNLAALVRCAFRYGVLNIDPALDTPPENT